MMNLQMEIKKRQLKKFKNKVFTPEDAIAEIIKTLCGILDEELSKIKEDINRIEFK